jgi:hypothetical protein
MSNQDVELSSNSVHVKLVDNDIENLVVIPGINSHGSFLIFVQDIDCTGANAIFMMSGNKNQNGSVCRVTSAVGKNFESLTIVWKQNECPKLKFLFLPIPATGLVKTYAIKVTSINM